LAGKGQSKNRSGGPELSESIRRQRSGGNSCTLLHEDEPERALYLAVPRRVREDILGEPLGQLIIQRLRLLVLVFSEEELRVIEWIN
jgi:hypothetical protein